jgi:hypothetical protein
MGLKLIYILFLLAFVAGPHFLFHFFHCVSDEDLLVIQPQRCGEGL